MLGNLAALAHVQHLKGLTGDVRRQERLRVTQHALVSIMYGVMHGCSLHVSGSSRRLQVRPTAVPAAGSMGGGVDETHAEIHR